MTNSDRNRMDPGPNDATFGDHQRFVELCALATAGPLPANEVLQLQDHLKECLQCCKTMAEFRFVAVEGSSLLVDESSSDSSTDFCRTEASSVGNESVSQERVKQALFARIAREADLMPESHSITDPTRLSIARMLATMSWQENLQYAIASVVLLSAVAIGGYRIGITHVRPTIVRGAAESTAPDQNRSVETQWVNERLALQEQLRSSTVTITRLSRELGDHTVIVQDLKKRLADAEAAAKRYADELSIASTKNVSFSSERDSLQQKLQSAEMSVISLQGDLESLRSQRQDDLRLVSSLQGRVDQLNGQLNKAQETVEQQQDFLVSDRDIRDLMGARNLYITDVVDVDKNGHTKKPFGRIFYTRGKSLVFYASDLDQQRELKNAAFQVWGQRGSERSNYVNMGIFYLDNQANRRWVLKFDDPAKLAQINAVFVTVEPDGGSPKPGGKQLLYASLRTLPNHP